MGRPAFVLSSEQIRAARALLRWEQRDLAAASLRIAAFNKATRMKPGTMAAHMSTVTALRNAIESAGVSSSKRTEAVLGYDSKTAPEEELVPGLRSLVNGRAGADHLAERTRKGRPAYPETGFSRRYPARASSSSTKTEAVPAYDYANARIKKIEKGGRRATLCALEAAPKKRKWRRIGDRFALSGKRKRRIGCASGTIAYNHRLCTYDFCHIIYPLLLWNDILKIRISIGEVYAVADDHQAPS